MTIKIVMKVIFYVGLSICLMSCSRESKTNHQTITVSESGLQNTLYYSGIIRPLQTVVITSPADGVVVEMPFQYGETVQPGQLLFMVSSSKFLSDYKTALMQYIKTKSEFSNSETQLKEAKFLHDHQLISDDEFKNKQATYYAGQLALLQAKDTLQILLKQLDVKGIDLYNLSIADINKITDAMHLQMSSENLRIIAPASGVVLSQSKNEDENKKIMKGDTVKQGDVLAVIGDLNGLSVRIKVNELTVNQLHIGQKVLVSGIAFGDVLEGKIQRVDRQGEPENNGLPTFAVEIVVPKLLPKQQEIIHVGMSAKIEIKVDEEPQIQIPLQALKEKNGLAYVKKYDKQLKKFAEYEVQTGKTSIDSVAIISGLKVGDKIAATY